MKIISRKDAKKIGLKFYFTGKPCKYGHISERRIGSACLICENIKQSSPDWKRKNNLASAKYRKSEKGKIPPLKYAKTEKGKLTHKKYRESKKGRETFERRRLKVYAQHKKWREGEKGKLYNKKKLSQTHYRLHDRLSSFFRNTIHKVSGTYRKNLTMRELTGLNKKQMVKYIESKWETGMTWKNHTRTGWHIDHIIPVDYFIKNMDYTDINVQKQCWNYKNLQPMWAKKNIKKSNKLT